MADKNKYVKRRITKRFEENAIGEGFKSIRCVSEFSEEVLLNKKIAVLENADELRQFSRKLEKEVKKDNDKFIMSMIKEMEKAKDFKTLQKEKTKKKKKKEK